MASPAVVAVILLSLLHHAISQYGVVAPNGMITVVTDGGSGPIYAQMPAAELPPAEVIVEEEPVIEIPAEEVGTRMFFRTNGNGGGYAAVAPPPPPPMTPAPLSNGYGAATPSNGARNRQFFRSNGNGNGHRYASAAPANGGRRNVFFRSNGNGYGSAAAAPAASNGARRQLFFRSNANGNGYATTAAPPAAPASNGYGTAVTSNGARSLEFFRSANGYAAATAAASTDARRSRGFFRSNGNGQSGSYGAPAPTPAPAPATNGYGQQGSSVTPVMAPSSFIPTELAEGVSIPQIPGVAGVDYPILSQALVTSFHCDDKPAPGYYADVESKCQVFYVCQQNVDRFTFLCPNGTMFNEKYSVCDWWYNVRCESSVAGGNGYAKPAPQMNGYARPPPPPPPTTTTTAAPVQHLYYSQPAVTEVDPTVAEVASGEVVISSEPVGDVVVDANGDALRMLNFRFNRLRPRVASRFRSNLRSNGGGYQTSTIVEEVPQDVIVAEDISLENGAGQNGQVANGNGYKNGGNGGRRMKSFLRSNRHRFNRLRNEGNGAEVQYGVPSSIQNGYGGSPAPAAPADGNGGLTTSAPANGNGGASSAAPTNGLLTTVAPSDVTEGDVTVVSIDTTTGQEEAVLTTESSEAQVNGEEPVIVMLNGNGDAPVNGNGQVSANGNGAAPTTNGAAPTNGNGGVVAIVNGNGGTALYGTRLRSMMRSLVRPRKMFRSGMLRMATPELAGTRYDPTMAAVNGNGQLADTIVQANGEPVFFRRARI